PHLARPQLGSSLTSLINHFAGNDSLSTAMPINIRITNEQPPRADALPSTEVKPKLVHSAADEFYHHQDPPSTKSPAAKDDGHTEHRTPLTHPWIQDAANVGSTLLTPVALLAGVWIMSRFLRGHAGPFIRIEHVG